MIVFKKSVLLAFAFSIAGCATLNKNENLKKMAIASVVGFGLGHLKQDNKEAYGAMYAGAAASGTAAYLFFEQQNKKDKLDLETEELRAKLDSLQKRYEPKIIQQGHSLFNSPIPKEVSGLVDPGEWKRYKMDQWVQDPNQQNVWYRQVEMFEFTPPSSR